MKINKILVLSVSALAVCGTLSAQDLRGVVRDAENQPLVGASVYWAETTIGASTSATGAYTVHRVKNYDRLVASYLGYVNGTRAALALMTLIPLNGMVDNLMRNSHKLDLEA